MSIWQYGEISRDGVWPTDCPFCKSSLKTVFEEVHDTRPILKTRISSHTKGVKSIKRCEICGWWKATDHSEHETIRPLEMRHSVMGASGSLKELDLQDINAPLHEVRSYLIARFEAGKKLHPQLMERTVADVFRGLGFQSVVTPYTGDGGIDAVLEKHGKLIGVQVKRTINSIKVEQIRSFAGALMIKGYTEGIFVTTSRFQSGAAPTAEASAVQGYKITLMDGQQLYDALKLVQINEALPFDPATAHQYFSNMTLISNETTQTYW
jgi:restriction system protein